MPRPCSKSHGRWRRDWTRRTRRCLPLKGREGRGCFAGSLERAPNELALSNLGTIAFGHGDYKKAIEDYGKAIELNPNNVESWRNLADSYAMVGDSEARRATPRRRRFSRYYKGEPKARHQFDRPSAFYHAKLGRKSVRGRVEDGRSAPASTSEGNSRRRKRSRCLEGGPRRALDLVLKLMDRGLSTVDVDLALDLKKRGRSNISAISLRAEIVYNLCYQRSCNRMPSVSCCRLLVCFFAVLAMVSLTIKKDLVRKVRVHGVLHELRHARGGKPDHGP